jgi:hypothetical protein
VVPAHRYVIFEDIGYYAALYNTALTHGISYILPLTLGVASFIYYGKSSFTSPLETRIWHLTAMALYHFNMRCIQFSRALNPGTTLTMSH